MNIPKSSRLRWYQLICPGLKAQPRLALEVSPGLNAKVSQEKGSVMIY